MKLITLLALVASTFVPFVDEPQKTEVPQPIIIQLKRR